MRSLKPFCQVFPRLPSTSINKNNNQKHKYCQITQVPPPPPPQTANRMDEHAIQATLSLARFGALRQALHMGQSEFAALRAPTDYAWLAGFGDRQVVIAAPTDHWFSLAAFEELRQRLPDMEVSS